MLPDCAPCCFFRLVETKGRHKRRLCMFTGEKRPYAGMSGCNFMPGQWSQLDRSLGLPMDKYCGNLDFPNQVKQVAAFSRNGMNVTDIHSLDDSIGFPINHTAKAKKGSLVRPGYREGQVAHLARERTRLPFHV